MYWDEVPWFTLVKSRHSVRGCFAQSRGLQLLGWVNGIVQTSFTPWCSFLIKLWKYYIVVSYSSLGQFGTTQSITWSIICGPLSVNHRCSGLPTDLSLSPCGIYVTSLGCLWVATEVGTHVSRQRELISKLCARSVGQCSCTDINSLRTRSHRMLGIYFLLSTFSQQLETVAGLVWHLTALSESLLEAFIVTGWHSSIHSINCLSIWLGFCWFFFFWGSDFSCTYTLKCICYASSLCHYSCFLSIQIFLSWLPCNWWAKHPRAWSLGKNLTWNQRELQPRGWDCLSWILKKHHQNASRHHVCVISKAKCVLAFLVEIIFKKKNTGRVGTHLRKESASKIWLTWLVWYIYRELFLWVELAEFNLSFVDLLRLTWVFPHFWKSNIILAFFSVFLHLSPVFLHLSWN